MAKDYRDIIRDNLDNTLPSGFVPELGVHRSGKVRNIHFTSEKLGSPVVMVASDRISSFDHILSRQIPFKGRVLNMFNRWAFEKSKDIVPNASLESPHPNVLVQKLCKNVMIECVVRGYVWGSLAADYEKGHRTLHGIEFKDGLLRYEKLPEPIFTPTMKSEHDEHITFAEAEKILGKTLAEKVKKYSIALYKRGAELAEKAGLIFIDTKYEFGLDEKGELLLIDEANTPDSSRYCSKDEYAKFEKIRKEMAGGEYRNVSELLEKKPELKIKELSKQFVRDVLIENGFSYGSEGAPPELSDDVVVEVAYRYIMLYEKLTGETFQFPQTNVRLDLLHQLQKSGMIDGGLAVIMAGSDSDMPHIEKIVSALESYGIKPVVRICSAHKQPAMCEAIVKGYNDSIEPIVFVTVAGGTDALSGVVSFHSVHPVLSCPPDAGKYESCVLNPPGSSNSLILRPKNVARHVAQILGHQNTSLREMLLAMNASKIAKLEAADGSL